LFVCLFVRISLSLKTILQNKFLCPTYVCVKRKRLCVAFLAYGEKHHKMYTHTHTHTHTYIYTQTHQPSNSDGEREREVHALLYNEIMSANKFERLYIKDFVCSCLPACLQCLPACLPKRLLCNSDFKSKESHAFSLSLNWILHGSHAVYPPNV
jgi:hypothetical protein